MLLLRCLCSFSTIVIPPVRLDYPRRPGGLWREIERWFAHLHAWVSGSCLCIICFEHLWVINLPNRPIDIIFINLSSIYDQNKRWWLGFGRYNALLILDFPLKKIHPANPFDLGSIWAAVHRNRQRESKSAMPSFYACHIGPRPVNWQPFHEMTMVPRKFDEQVALLKDFLGLLRCLCVLQDLGKWVKPHITVKLNWSLPGKTYQCNVHTYIHR